MRRPGFEPGTSGTGGAGPSHWATLCFVLDLELLVILRWVGAIRLKLKEKFSTGLTTERGSSGRADGAGRLPRAAVAAACVRWCVRTKERKRRRRGSQRARVVDAGDAGVERTRRLNDERTERTN